MNCPVCDAKLRAVEKYGVEVDICPDCKGVWLDRGELDKILEMASAGGPVIENRSNERDERSQLREPDYQHPEKEHGHKYDPQTGKPKRKGSWLSDILEGFGGD